MIDLNRLKQPNIVVREEFLRYLIAELEAARKVIATVRAYIMEPSPESGIAYAKARDAYDLLVNDIIDLPHSETKQ